MGVVVVLAAMVVLVVEDGGGRPAAVGYLVSGHKCGSFAVCAHWTGCNVKILLG